MASAPTTSTCRPSQIRRFNLHTGDMVEGEVRVPKDGERYFALVKVDRVNGLTPEESKHKIMFENLTPLFPKEQFKLERDIKADENITSRIIDLIAPIGKGQRACWWPAQDRQDGDDAAPRACASWPTTPRSTSSCCSSTSGPRK
jgi:transcription termination factor Rho